MNPENPQIPLFPDSASSFAGQVDYLFFAWSAISVFFTLLIAAAIVYFMVRYRRRSEDEVGANETASFWLEVAWSVIPLIIALAMFVWGTRVYFHMFRPPVDAIEYFSVGKQWMWKFQHPDGHREINTLHIPVGRPIKLNLQSEDVIHSFFVPAFRVKQDAVPGRTTSVWFEATKPGTYHLFCAEYCGGEHSRMIGSVIAMEARDYEDWLAGSSAGKSLVASGADLFETLACATCHRQGDAATTPGTAANLLAQGPSLEKLYGSQVQLQDGRAVTADDDYLRESILNPQAKIVAGWQPVMPTFQGQVSEEQMTQLLSYIRSLSQEEEGTSAPASPAAPAAAEDAATGTAGGETGSAEPNRN